MLSFFITLLVSILLVAAMLYRFDPVEELVIQTGMEIDDYREGGKSALSSILIKGAILATALTIYAQIF